MTTKAESTRLNPLDILVAAIASFATVVAVWPGGAGASTRASTITVTAGKPSEFGFILSAKTAPHGAVTFKVTNRGALPHDFKICKTGGMANACAGSGTNQLSPG